MEDKQVYYLISQDYYSGEFMDVMYKPDVLSAINDNEINVIYKEDIEEHIDNLFEVVQEDVNCYTIIDIHIHLQLMIRYITLVLV